MPETIIKGDPNPNKVIQIIQNKKNKKIFILSGKNSFKLSGAKELIKKFLKNKDCYFLKYASTYIHQHIFVYFYF